MTMQSPNRIENPDQLSVRLEAFAIAHLDQAPAATERMRSFINLEAQRTLSARLVADDASLLSQLGRLFRRPVLALAGMLVGLALVTSGTLAASAPGGPLYGPRLWAETLTLPSDANARASAELARLQTRLDEATSAAANGNSGAVSAALEAYRETLADTLAAAGNDPTREQRISTELGRHLAALAALAGPPGSASSAIGQAVVRTEDKIKTIIRTSGQPNNPSNPGGSNNGNPNGGLNPGPAGPTSKPPDPNPGQPGATSKPPDPNPGQLQGDPNPEKPADSARPGYTPDPNKVLPTPGG